MGRARLNGTALDGAVLKNADLQGASLPKVPGPLHAPASDLMLIHQPGQPGR